MRMGQPLKEEADISESFTKFLNQWRSKLALKKTGCILSCCSRNEGPISRSRAGSDLADLGGRLAEPGISRSGAAAA